RRRTDQPELRRRLGQSGRQGSRHRPRREARADLPGELMARPQSIAFRALDLHIVQGRADETALATPTGTLSYAQLLHESASLAGGLRDLGLRQGAPVKLSVPDRHVWVVSVLAIVRLGAEPDPEASFSITGDPAVVRAGGEEYEFDLIVRAG